MAFVEHLLSGDEAAKNIGFFASIFCGTGCCKNDVRPDADAVIPKPAPYLQPQAEDARLDGDAAVVANPAQCLQAENGNADKEYAPPQAKNGNADKEYAPPQDDYARPGLESLLSSSQMEGEDVKLDMDAPNSCSQLQAESRATSEATMGKALSISFSEKEAEVVSFTDSDDCQMEKGMSVTFSDKEAEVVYDSEEDEVQKVSSRPSVTFSENDAEVVTIHDSEEDEDGEEPPPDFYKDVSRCRGGISAEAHGSCNGNFDFVAPEIPKTIEQASWLKTCLSQSFTFSSLEDRDLSIVIGAMKEITTHEFDTIVQQGDQGDFVFVVEKGKLNCCIKSPDGADEVVKTCEPGDVFGDLALLYNAPRAATVVASENCVLWQLDRDTFNNIVKAAAQRKRERYEEFLKRVPVLKSMDAHERSQLCDALKVEIYEDGYKICQTGDVGNKFYIIEEGAAVAMQGDVHLMNYDAGDYFGELALIRNQYRAATITTKGPTKLLTIDSDSFKRLLHMSEFEERAAKY